jgi:Chaperone of endosialidase
MRKIFFTALCTAWAFISFAQQKVGINTTNPKAELHIADQASNFLVGDSMTGPGSKLMWVGSRSAFRAGILSTGPNSRSWNLDSIGYYSFAFGNNVKALDYYGIAMGSDTRVKGPSNIGIGTSMAVRGGFGNVAMGQNIYLDGAFGTTAIGHTASIVGDHGLASIGFDNTCEGSYGLISMGSNNSSYGTHATIAIGDDNIANGFNGSIAIGHSNTSNNSFGNIAIGNENLSTGSHGSMAIGESNHAEASSAIAIGFGNTVTGYSGSSAYGINCRTTGDNGSAAIGKECITTGSNGAVSLGHYNSTVASYGATTIGDHNVAKAMGETVVGVYNDTLDFITPPSSSSYIATDRIFTVGNGFDFLGGQIRTNALVILKSGRVGLGENRPTNLLQLRTESGLTNNLQLMIDEASTGYARVGFANNSIIGWTLSAHRDNTPSFSSMNFYSNQLNADVLSLRGDGSACFYGNVKANVVSTCSDIRYKSNVKTIKHALQKVQGIDGVTYNYKVNEYADQHFPTHEQAGLIAQQVESVLPQIVYTDDKGYKSVDYAKVVPLLVEAIKELNKELDNVKKSNELLTTSLEARLSALEGRELKDISVSKEKR